jgi:hypothetical protein
MSRPRLPVLAPRAPGAPKHPDERPCAREHTEADWEAKKEIITELYIRENRRLYNTMAILESTYAFSAT